MTASPTPRRSERGASAVEYGLLITGIAAIIALTVFLFGGNVGLLYQDTCDKLTSQTAQADDCQ